MSQHSTDAPDQPRVEIVRSRNRRRTVSAHREGDRTVIRVPAGLPAHEEQRCVADMLARLERREARSRVGDDGLGERAAVLSRTFLAGRARPASVRWVTNQNSRWGSCTPYDATIRLSHRLRPMPAWVIDYVLVHELTHLLVHGHGPEFWRLVEAYPRTERARGFLDGVALAAGYDLPQEDDLDEVGVDSSSCGGATAVETGPAA